MLLPGMSPRLGVNQVLRALPVGLHRGGDVDETLSHATRRGEVRGGRSGTITDHEGRRGDQENLRRRKKAGPSSFKNLSQREEEGRVTTGRRF